MAESKKGSRSTGDYTMEETPLKGGSEGARRFGSMEWGALMGHTGLESEIAKDAKLIRGQMNHEFWQKVRNGETPDKPGIPLVHKKFFAHLQAAGINVEDRGRTVHFFGATDEDIRRLTKNRQVTTASTYDAKDLRPIKGGLFDPNIFGENGDQWGYYDLPEPILNPMMAKSIQAILGWKQSEMQEVLEGAREVNGKVGTEAIMDALDNMDLDKELRDTKALLKSKSTPVSKRSDLAKKYRALYAIKENDKQPNDFFLTRIPILPPRYRAVSIIGNDVGIVSDANFLYKKFIDAVEDFKEAKQVLPQEELLDARKTLYNSIEAVIGLRDPEDPKLQSKKVEGVLAWVTGKSSPKLGSTHRKVFGTTVDIGGRNVISPDNSLALDEVGISEETAWSMYEPFVVRKLRQRGMSMTGAVDAVINKDKEALVKTREILKTMWTKEVKDK
jgi:DNA-directed RNA polymerase beta' subunit